MIIGINLLFLKPKLAGGTETYTYGLLKGLADESPSENTYYIFCSYELSLEFLHNKANFNIIKISIGTSVAYRCFYEQLIFPFKLKKYRLNVLHSFGYIGPISQKNHLVTIHDTNAFTHEDMSYIKKFFLASLMKLTAKKCAHIIAVSAFSKTEIIKNLQVLPQKISVIYEACKYSISNEKYLLPKKLSFLKSSAFFIALSSVSKNKNIITLVTAFKKLSIKYPDVKLVLVGYLPPDNTIQKKITDEQLKDKVVITGYADEQTLLSLFQHSTGFIFPSLYEGFGLPLLEAQTLGVPVIASDKTSLPEIGQNSVLYFDGTNTDVLCEEMMRLLSVENLRKQYINAGYENIKRFSWNAAAQQVINLYNLNNNAN